MLSESDISIYISLWTKYPFCSGFAGPWLENIADGGRPEYHIYTTDGGHKSSGPVEGLVATLPQTNSKFAPENRPKTTQKERNSSEPTLTIDFYGANCAASFRGGGNFWSEVMWVADTWSTNSAWVLTVDDLRICFWCDLEKPLLQRDIHEYHTPKICQIIRWC